MHEWSIVIFIFLIVPFKLELSDSRNFLLRTLEIPLRRQRLLKDIIYKSSANFQLDDQVNENGLPNAKVILALQSPIPIVFNRLGQSLINEVPPVVFRGSLAMLHLKRISSQDTSPLFTVLTTQKLLMHLIILFCVDRCLHLYVS